MVSSLQTEKKSCGIRVEVNNEHSFIVAPPSLQFPKIGNINGVNYNSWWWQNVRHIRMSAESTLKSQGYSATLQKQSFLDLSTFKPKDSFIWLEEQEELEFVQGPIEECSFCPPKGMDVYVPTGWGNSVLRMVRQYGIVLIEDWDHQNERPQQGVRWDTERVNLNEIEHLGWFR